MNKSSKIVLIYAAIVVIALSGFTYAGFKGHTWLKIGSTRSNRTLNGPPLILLHK